MALSDLAAARRLIELLWQLGWLASGGVLDSRDGAGPFLATSAKDRDDRFHPCFETRGLLKRSLRLTFLS
jgi:hypothetical protein